MNKPVDIRPFGVVTKNGVEYFLLYLRGPVGLGKVDKMRGEPGNGFIPAEAFEQRDMFIEIDKVEEAVVYFTGMMPYIHREDQAYFEDQEEKTLHDLDGVGYEKGGLHGDKDHEDGDHQPNGKVF